MERRGKMRNRIIGFLPKSIAALAACAAVLAGCADPTALPRFTVSFNYNQGSGTAPPPQTVEAGSSITLPGNAGLFSRTGYNFAGWATNADGTGTIHAAGSTYTPSADRIMFARWEARGTFTVSFNANGGTGQTPPAQTVEAGTATTLPGAGGLSRTGFDFGGWNERADGTGANRNAGAIFTPTRNISLYARWVPEAPTARFTITFDANGGIGQAPPAQTVEAGTAATLPGAGGLSRAGFAFSGWNERADGTGANRNAGAAFTPTGDISLYARWVPEAPAARFTITFDANGGTGQTPPAQTVEAGTAATLPGAGGLSRAGFDFGGWNERADGTGANRNAGAAFTPTGNISLYARWVPEAPTARFTITFDANGGIGQAPPAQTVDDGTVVTLPGAGGLSRAGFDFGGWNERADGTGANRDAGAAFTPTGDISLYAQWVPEPPTAAPPMRVASGGSHTVALRTNGTLWAWGDNRQGQVGDGTTTSRHSPVQIGTADNWAGVSAGSTHTVALRTDGTLWAWGNNGSGRLGDGTTTSRQSPVQIGAGMDWAYVSAGSTHTVAVGTDGTLWAWGHNWQGQLGDGTTSHRHSPVQIGTASDWVSVSAGWQHTVGVRANGTLWAWGTNGHGRLGDGTTTSRHSPVRIGTASNWDSVSAGNYHTVAVRSDGTLWAWGRGAHGMLGDGATTDRHSPVRIGTASNWDSVSASRYHTVAVRTDGTLWAWGHGMLGNGPLTTQQSPMRIGTASNWDSASAGSHTVGMQRDGTVWTWGFNGHGQLGDGTTTQRTAPVRID